MKAVNIKTLLALSSLFLALNGCSAKSYNDPAHTPQNPSTKVLKVAKIKNCQRGFIKPPGVRACLKIDDIVTGNIDIKAPQGRCPRNWSRLTAKGFCLPENRVVSCSGSNFSCGTKRSDTLRIEKGLPRCDAGGMLVAIDFPRFNPSGTLTLDATVCLTCGPVERIPEV